MAAARTSMLRWLRYAAVIGCCFALGMLVGWNPLAVRVDNQTYDELVEPLAASSDQEAVVVAIDAATLKANGERQNLRRIVAMALNKIAAAQPKAVALDVTLAGYTDREQDALLEQAVLATPNLVMPCLVDGADQWEEPAPRFAAAATTLGHVHYERNESDGVSRKLTLERVHGGERRWALALEALRVAHRSEIVENPPQGIEVAGRSIPTLEPDRFMYIRYLASDAIPVISVSALEGQAQEQLHGKTVFLGVTAIDLRNDSLKIPTGETIAGVTVHAHAYETLRRGRFLVDASPTLILATCMGLCLCIALAFAFLQGWRAFVAVAPLLLLAVILPAVFLARDIVFPLVAPTAVTWLTAIGAAAFQYFAVRNSLAQAESDKARYQQAIHWAAHEMRTPLTAIQGSSELMTKYQLPDEKRGQLNEMIHAESKRLARIIQTFLDVERLADGQMELKREPIAASEIVATCVQRAQPLAERKNIRLSIDNEIAGTLLGDRELLEYAFYNLLTNAIKYSGPDTQVRVGAEVRRDKLHLAVKDQGMGMDAKELKQIFKKFYRTKRAEASGEVGTGIGLSIVQQIVAHHGGTMDVTSTPGKGSCFTMIVTVH
jgi:signal transduction histidine kinase